MPPIISHSAIVKLRFRRFFSEHVGIRHSDTVENLNTI